MRPKKSKVIVQEELFLEKTDILAEQLHDLSPLNCRFYIQDWRAADSSDYVMPVQGPIDVFWAAAQSDEIRDQLVKLFTEFCNVIGETGEAAKSTQQLLGVQFRNRDKEMKWMENNKELLAKLAGKWVVIESDQLVSSSEDFTLAFAKAKDSGIKVPFILYIPEVTKTSTIGI